MTELEGVFGSLTAGELAQAMVNLKVCPAGVQCGDKHKNKRYLDRDKCYGCWLFIWNAKFAAAQSKEAGVTAPTSNEHSEKVKPNVPTAIVPERKVNGNV